MFGHAKKSARTRTHANTTHIYVRQIYIWEADQEYAMRHATENDNGILHYEQFPSLNETICSLIRNVCVRLCVNEKVSKTNVYLLIFLNWTGQSSGLRQ